jgi:hypothetical protein
MGPEKRFAVIQVPDLIWPPTLEVPSKRFRLLVAADTSSLSTETVTDFILSALNQGMVYFCSWGPDCERFHDIVDDVVLGDSLTQQTFSGTKPGDVIMTTWHANETLEEALDFFAISAIPTEGFLPESDFRLVISVGNSDWAATANQFLQSAEFFV